MNQNQDREVELRPNSIDEAKKEINESFVFGESALPGQAEACRSLEAQAHDLANSIAELVPEGKCRTVAINNILGALLWARHGILAQPVAQMGSQTDSPDVVTEGSGTPGWKYSDFKQV